jgi:hypothetical protein
MAAERGMETEAAQRLASDGKFQAAFLSARPGKRPFRLHENIRGNARCPKFGHVRRAFVPGRGTWGRQMGARSKEGPSLSVNFVARHLCGFVRRQ